MDNRTPQRRAPRRTQAERRGLSGRSLVEAAIAVVARDGVAAATFETIGREAGYSRSLVTQRFGSKRGLIEAVISALHAHSEANLSAHGIDDLDGLEAVLAYVDIYLRGLDRESDGRAYFMMLSAAVADATEFRRAFADEHARVERRIEALVRRGQAEGVMRRDLDPASTALMIGALLLGISMQLLVDPETQVGPIRVTSLATLRASFGAVVDNGEESRS